MTRKVSFYLVRFQIPYLVRNQPQSSTTKHNTDFHTFSVLSLLALISILESALHASLYTAPTCPLSVATNFPVRPSHTLTAPSHPADAALLPSGEKATCDIWRWCPVSRARGFVADPVVGVEDGDEEGKGDQRKRVWSSEPEISSSGVLCRRAVYLALASSWARGRVGKRSVREEGWELYTFFVCAGLLPFMIERTGTKYKIGVEGEGRHPVCVVLERMYRSTL